MPDSSLDVTHSLRVAASFASHENDTDEAFVFVFGVPNLSGAVTASSEAGLQIIRLSSVMSPRRGTTSHTRGLSCWVNIRISADFRAERPLSLPRNGLRQTASRKILFQSAVILEAARIPAVQLTLHFIRLAIVIRYFRLAEDIKTTIKGNRITHVRPHPRQIHPGHHAPGHRRRWRCPAHQPAVLDVLPQDHRRSGPGARTAQRRITARRSRRGCSGAPGRRTRRASPARSSWPSSTASCSRR